MEFGGDVCALFSVRVLGIGNKTFSSKNENVCRQNNVDLEAMYTCIVEQITFDCL